MDPDDRETIAAAIERHAPHGDCHHLSARRAMRCFHSSCERYFPVPMISRELNTFPLLRIDRLMLVLSDMNFGIFL